MSRRIRLAPVKTTLYTLLTKTIKKMETEQEQKMTDVILDDEFKRMYSKELVEGNHEMAFTEYRNIPAKEEWNKMWRKYRYDVTERLIVQKGYIHGRDTVSFPIRKCISRELRSSLHNSLVRNGKGAQLFFFEKMKMEFNKALKEMDNTYNWDFEFFPPTEENTYMHQSYFYLNEYVTGKIVIKGNEEKLKRYIDSL